jgi:type IV pilus assembly protein PilV
MTTHTQQSGSILLESLIAILIFSLGIMALAGMQAISMQNTTLSKTRIDASLVASQRIGKMWVDQGLNGSNLPTYVETDTPVPELPNGLRTTRVQGDQVTVTVTWQMPADPVVNTYTTITRITNNPP